jgi:DNA invertase Pin-like site-specific DNA recombinase
MESKKVFVYCRKSQESEERQALSIPSQIETLEKIAKRDGYKLVNPYYLESQSAKKPGRIIFNQMLQEMEKQQVHRVLVWNPDRLSRNSVDTGQIIYLMDRNVLEEIITPTQVFKNNPNDKFLFNILCGQAKLENDNRGINAKRGMTTKANMGWYPAPAPLGYKNTPDKKKGFKTINIDEEKFDLVKRLFTEIIKGKQAFKVYEEASKEWKLTSHLGNIISKSGMYYILNNPFYYGEYEWPRGSGIWFKGKHEAMITREEFDIVQNALGKYGKPIAHSHTFDLTGLFRCEKCGCAITGSKKTKFYKKRTATYVYYHCTKKNKKIDCDSSPVKESDFVEQIYKLLLSIKPDKEFIDWSKKWLHYIDNDQTEFKEEILESQRKELKMTENRLDRLLDMKLNDMLDDAKYKEKKEKLEKEKKEIEEKLSKLNEDSNNKKIRIENDLDFAYACKNKFEIGLREEKQEILIRIGENLYLNNDELLDVKLKRVFKVLADKDKWGEQYKDWLEPVKYTEIMEKNSDLRPANPVWLRELNEYRNYFLNIT